MIQPIQIVIRDKAIVIDTGEYKGHTVGCFEVDHDISEDLNYSVYDTNGHRAFSTSKHEVALYWAVSLAYQYVASELRSYYDHMKASQA